MTQHWQPVMRQLVDELERRTAPCPHQDTVRRGAIWTYCHQCEKLWADDQDPPTTIQPACLAEARKLLDGAEIPPSQRPPLTDQERRVEDAIWVLETYGRGRIKYDQRIGPWIQIDHDRTRIEALEAAARYLQSLGLAERHPRKGNPRNVRIIRK